MHFLVREPRLHRKARFLNRLAAKSARVLDPAKRGFAQTKVRPDERLVAAGGLWRRR